MTRIAVVSSRALIAHALAESLAAVPGVEVWLSSLEALGAGDRRAEQASTCVVIDLDDAIGHQDIVQTAMVSFERVRRVAVFDTFTGHHARMAFDLGVTGLVALTAPVETVVAAVLGPASGDRPSSVVTAAAGASRDDLLRLSTLSPRELEVLALLGAGTSVHDLAERLAITPHTAASHKRRVFAKLGLQSQTQAAVFAARAGIDVSVRTTDDD
ncbi:MAG: LuxR C-terminal-related transcriptional regulator [Actinomycetota bacterium]